MLIVTIRKVQFSENCVDTNNITNAVQNLVLIFSQMLRWKKICLIKSTSDELGTIKAKFSEVEKYK